MTAAIVGARSPEQVDGWIAGGSLRLTKTDMQEIEEALKSTGAGTGPISAAHSGGSSEEGSDGG